MSRRQLLRLGLSPRSIERRLSSGRLHPVMRGVYAVGRPGVTLRGRWMAAILACAPHSAVEVGAQATLSHGSAAALWGIAPDHRGPIQVSVRSPNERRARGVEVHRRPALRESDVGVHERVPTTAIVQTLIDLATELAAPQLERAVNEADRLDLIDPERLRGALDERRGQPGVPRLRDLLDRRTFCLTASELERRFLPIARRAGLPLPLTGRRVNGFIVDFYWPELGLVVETDGLRYHRTPTQQARDRLRDQAHSRAGLTPLRFTHAQVRFEPAEVRQTLAVVSARLTGDAR